MKWAYVSTSPGREKKFQRELGLPAWHLPPVCVCEFKQVSVTSADNRKPLCSGGTSCSCQLAGFDVVSRMALVAPLAQEQDKVSVQTQGMSF